MAVCRGILLPWAMPLILHILPVVCFLGLLLFFILHLLTLSGRPKTALQCRKIRRRLARLYNKPGNRTEKLKSRVSSIERRFLDEASPSPYWSAVLVSFVGGVQLRDEPKLVDASLKGTPTKFSIADNCNPVCFTVISWIQNLAPTTAAAADQPVAGCTSKRKKTTQKLKQEAKRLRGKKDDDLSDGEPDGGDDDGGPDDRRNAAPDGKYWACPFFVFDPKNNYICAEKHKLKRLSDVKLHLIRDHFRERFWECLRCWARWPRKNNNIVAHQTHVQLGTCEGINGTEELSEAEVNRIKAVRGGTDRSKWYAIWNIVFEGHAPPASPFVEEGLDAPRELLEHNARSNGAVEQLLARSPPPSRDEMIDAILRAPFAVPSRLRRPAPGSQAADIIPLYSSHPNIAAQDPNIPLSLGGVMLTNNAPAALHTESPVSVGLHQGEDELILPNWLQDDYYVDLSNLSYDDELNYDLGGNMGSPSHAFDPSSGDGSATAQG